MSEGVYEAPTFMEWSTMVVPTYPEGGSRALQVCQHHHQVVRVGHFVGLSETQGTCCSRLHRPIRLKPSRYHSAKRALWYREGGGPWPVRPRARCSFALNRVTDGDIIFGPNPVMALSYDVPRGRSRTRSNVLLTTAHTPVVVEPTRHLAQCRAHTSPTAL